MKILINIEDNTYAVKCTKCGEVHDTEISRLMRGTKKINCKCGAIYSLKTYKNGSVNLRRCLKEEV